MYTLLLNTVNNKCYVGQHKGITINTRWTKNLDGANPHLARSLKKYGPDAFKREILNVCSDKAEMDRLETLWIISLRTYDPEFGYNKVIGTIPEPTKGKHWITDGKSNMLISDFVNIPECWHKGRKQKGYTNPGIGTRSLESKLKQSVSAKIAWEKRRERGDDLQIKAQGIKNAASRKGKSYKQIFGVVKAEELRAGRRPSMLKTWAEGKLKGRPRKILVLKVSTSCQ